MTAVKSMRVQASLSVARAFSASAKTILSGICLVSVAALAVHAPSIHANEPIVADGSSTVYPLTREAARRFQRSQRDANIEVSFSGTTAGFRRFCEGGSDIANASRPMNAQEQTACEAKGIRYRHVPVAIDAIAVVVHPRNTWVNDITVSELRSLWAPDAEGRVKTWRQVRAQWPDQPIVLFGRGQDSGTYDEFTTRVVGTARSSRLDYTASEDEELLAASIARQPNALGFFGIGAYHRHWDELKLVAIDDGSGQGPVFPTLETVSQGQYRPLTRRVYVYVNEESLTSKAHLKPFLSAYVSGIRQWIHFTGYMPLAESDYRDGLKEVQRAP